ncbi:MAG TPA: amino acid permease [Pyrinomonadaceae bacterium]|jgi:APA family basic amino acid/polyamine antiporter|nr:amino acid permease [Pyrinomonadaceae bacterium]
MTTPTLTPNITLFRGLTLIAAISIIIGNVIGTGVFLKARVMTCNVGTPGMVITVWVVAGLLSLAGALTYAELAAMMPRAGGEYVFVREAYGSATSFLYGWMQVFIAKTGSQASVAVAFAIFLNDLVGGALTKPYFTLNFFGYGLPFGPLQLVALGLIILITLLNCAAVVVSGWVATLLTCVKIALVLGIGVGAFLLVRGDWGHYAMANAGGLCEGVDAAARFGVAGFGAAMLGALWGYDGWNNLTLVAGEVKNPQRNVPLALIGGTITIILLYVFVNLAYFYVLDPTAVASVPKSSSVAREVALQFLGPVAISLMAAGLMASSVGTLHTSILTGARVPYAMSRDGLFFQNLARLNPRTRVPIGALIVQGVWACILALSGSFDTLTDYVIFGSWIFYGLVTASIFLFRRRMPDAHRPYRAWGYPVVPVLFLLVTGFLLVNTLLTTPTQALIGLALIALGLPVYYFFFRHRRIVDPEPASGDY